MYSKAGTSFIYINEPKMMTRISQDIKYWYRFVNQGTNGDKGYIAVECS